MDYWIVELYYGLFSDMRFKNRDDAVKYAKEVHAFAMWFNGDYYDYKKGVFVYGKSITKLFNNRH